MIMCWLTPKFVEGSSEKADMLRFGSSSQSAGGESGRCPVFVDAVGFAETLLLELEEDGTGLASVAYARP